MLVEMDGLGWVGGERHSAIARTREEDGWRTTHSRTRRGDFSPFVAGISSAPNLPPGSLDCGWTHWGRDGGTVIKLVHQRGDVR